MPFTKIFADVEAHNGTILMVVYTNDEKTVARYIERYKQYLDTLHDKIIGVHVEYTNETDPNRKAAIIQLCIDKSEPMLLYQVSVAKERCHIFDNFLKDPKYTFAGFSIDQDIKKLQRVKLVITNLVDIQKNWRVPTAMKPLDSLGNVATAVVDNYYPDMKGKMTNQDNMRRQWVPLSRKHIEYATKDVFAAFKIWSHISWIKEGLDRAPAEKGRNRGRTWGDTTWGNWH